MSDEAVLFLLKERLRKAKRNKWLYAIVAWISCSIIFAFVGAFLDAVGMMSLYDFSFPIFVVIDMAVGYYVYNTYNSEKKRLREQLEPDSGS